MSDEELVLEVESEDVFKDLSKIQDSLSELAGRVFAEIEDHDATEGRDYRLMAVWAELRHQRDSLLQIKYIIKRGYLL
jgi:hypothetical protein